jgi:hypothetical protein
MEDVLMNSIKTVDSQWKEGYQLVNFGKPMNELDDELVSVLRFWIDQYVKVRSVSQEHRRNLS